MSTGPPEVPLYVAGSGLEPSKARRNDDVVLRDAGPGSPLILALLRHLEAEGFEGAPRVVGTGFAADGRECLSYLEGNSPHPHAWPDEALPRLGDLLRVQRARAMGSEGGGLDVLIACVRKLVFAGGCKSRPGSRQGAW